MPRRLYALTALLFLAAGVSAPPAAGQVSPQNQEDLFDTRNPRYPSSADKAYQERSLLRNTAPQVLEANLDPREYVVGPGDVFQLIIWGGRDEQYELQVNPLGTVVVPTVGEIRVGERTLEEALGLIRDEVTRNYDNIEYSLNLIQLRRFRVYVTGQVTDPGTYFLQGTDRLADVLGLVGGVSKWADDTAIEIRGSGGSVRTVDLSEFYVSGNKNANPTLAGGDVIHVPPVDLEGPYVFFEGTLIDRQENEQALNRILRPEELPSELQGIFPIHPGEMLPRFLHRIHAVDRGSDLARITVLRGGESFQFDVLEASELQQFMEFELQHQDRVVVRTRRDRVYVRGEVRQPGAYPYLTDRTASDYAGVAGVMDSGASPGDYYVLRAGTGEKLKGKDVVVQNGDTVVIPQRGRENFKDYVQIIFPIASLAISVIALTSR